MAQYGLTDKGPNPKRLDIILEEMHDSMSKRLGVNTRQNPQSLLNHLLTNVADRIAELWEYGTDVYYSMYPASASGVNLDNAAQFGGSTRGTAAKSYYDILCTGTDGTTVPAGTIIASDTNPATKLTNLADGSISRENFSKVIVKYALSQPTGALTAVLDGNLYTFPYDATKTLTELLRGISEAITDEAFTTTVNGEEMTIEAKDVTSSHSLVLSENLTTKEVSSVIQFATEDYGDILIPNGVITKIVKSVAGLTAVTNVGTYIAGHEAETDAEFRQSYADKIFGRSSSMLESIRSAILENVQGVLSCAAYENDTNETDDMGRPAHSVELVVDGGDEEEIAQQILNKKAGGISSYGSVAKTVPGLYGEDIIVRFNRPSYIKVWFKVTVTFSKNTNPPTNYAELIKEQIVEKMSALEAGDDVVPQTFHVEVSGINYVDIMLYGTEGDEMPTEYNARSIEVDARHRAVTDESRIEVVIDG